MKSSGTIPLAELCFRYPPFKYSQAERFFPHSPHWEVLYGRTFLSNQSFSLFILFVHVYSGLFATGSVC